MGSHCLRCSVLFEKRTILVLKYVYKHIHNCEGERENWNKKTSFKKYFGWHFIPTLTTVLLLCVCRVSTISTSWCWPSKVNYSFKSHSSLHQRHIISACNKETQEKNVEKSGKWHKNCDILKDIMSLSLPWRRTNIFHARKALLFHCYYSAL